MQKYFFILFFLSFCKPANQNNSTDVQAYSNSTAASAQVLIATMNPGKMFSSEQLVPRCSGVVISSNSILVSDSNCSNLGTQTEIYVQKNKLGNLQKTKDEDDASWKKKLNSFWLKTSVLSKSEVVPGIFTLSLSSSLEPSAAVDTNSNLGHLESLRKFRLAASDYACDADVGETSLSEKKAINQIQVQSVETHGQNTLISVKLDRPNWACFTMMGVGLFDADSNKLLAMNVGKNNQTKNQVFLVLSPFASLLNKKNETKPGVVSQIVDSLSIFKKQLRSIPESIAGSFPTLSSDSAKLTAVCPNGTKDFRDIYPTVDAKYIFWVPFIEKSTKKTFYMPQCHTICLKGIDNTTVKGVDHAIVEFVTLAGEKKTGLIDRRNMKDYIAEKSKNAACSG